MAVIDYTCITSGSEYSKSVRLLFKGDGNMMITMRYMKDLNKPIILLPVSSKSVEKCRSCGHLYICKWTVMEAAIL